jgi:hypothetical protein
MVSVMPRLCFTLGKGPPVPIGQEAGWARAGLDAGNRQCTTTPVIYCPILQITSCYCTHNPYVASFVQSSLIWDVSNNKLITSWQYSLYKPQHAQLFMHFVLTSNNKLNILISWSTCLYSEGPEFKSWPRDQLSWLRLFMVFLSPSRQMSGLYLNLGHDHFFPHSFQFIIH